MARAKSNYEELVRASLLAAYPDSTAISLVRSSQGYSSTTYFVELQGLLFSSIVIQARPETRPLPLENLDRARRIFGELAPTGKLLNVANNSKEAAEPVLLYQMSRIEGTEISSILNPDAFPPIAASLASILAQAIVPNTLARQTSPSITTFDHRLDLAVRACTDTDNPAYQSLQPVFSSLLSRLRAGELGSLSMTLSNDDISPTNILVNLQGAAVSGIADWENTAHYPLEYDAAAVFFLVGRYKSES